MSNPTRTRKSNRTPVVTYPEGVTVGFVRSGRSSSGAVRHIAYRENSSRLGTFDMFREASDALIAEHRRTQRDAKGELLLDLSDWATPEPALVWTPRTPDERRRTEVAALVAKTLAKPEGQRYAAAYGTLSALVISDIPGVGTEWAREYVRGLKASM